MIEVEEARRLIRERTRALPAEMMELRASLGRVLAEDVVSDENVPAFDNSSLDGYAVRAVDTRGARRDAPSTLRVTDESRAGHPAGSDLGAGQAIAISTGGEIPAGADAVVALEQSRPRGPFVETLCEVRPGHAIRRAGDDINAGATVLKRGARLGPAEIGVLASLGRPQLLCTRRPSVSVLVTGDELIEPTVAARAGAVRNSNGYTIPALAERAGAEVRGIVTVADDLDSTREAIVPALTSDVAVICGGVSVGPHDHVKQALSDLGVEEVFWRVALKPGKPTWFGRHSGGLLFGLPGNPVSAMVTFILFVRPALLLMSGSTAGPLRTSAVLGREYEKTPGRAHAVRCRLELNSDGWRAWPTEKHDSHILTSMIADALAFIPTASGNVRAGERVEIELLTEG